MAGIGGWVRAMVCGGAILATGVVWLTPGRASAQQREGAMAPVEVQGDAAHGRYLVERVVMCGECHSTRDQAGDIVEGTFLHGGPMPARVAWSADWPVQVPRIAGLPGYTDIEAQRLLTQGAIRRNGIQARAPMPRFRMTPQDAADVIAFLRTQ